MRLLIADDHVLFAQALSAALAAYEIDVVGIAADGDDAIRMAQEREPDVIVLDLDMPRVTGFEVLETLRQLGSDSMVAVLTGGDAASDRVRALKLGATAFLKKTQPLDEIAQALKLVGALGTAPAR
jgi:DNA-binding NarL/FixJ family response regulator